MHLAHAVPRDDRVLVDLLIQPGTPQDQAVVRSGLAAMLREGPGRSGW